MIGARTLRAALLAVAFAGAALAQTPCCGPGGGPPGMSLDLTKTRTIAGAITAVSIGYGMQAPSITVNEQTIRIAPVWFLLDKGFELKAGDKVSLTAAPSTVGLHALEIRNLTTKRTLQLRDAQGLPLWRGGRRTS